MGMEILMFQKRYNKITPIKNKKEIPQSEVFLFYFNF